MMYVCNNEVYAGLLKMYTVSRKKKDQNVEDFYFCVFVIQKWTSSKL